MVTRHSAVQNKLTDGFNTRESSFTGFALPEDSKISSCTFTRGCPGHIWHTDTQSAIVFEFALTWKLQNKRKVANKKLRITCMHVDNTVWSWLALHIKCSVWVLSVSELQAMMTRKLAAKMVMAGRMTWKTLQRVQAVATSMAG